MAIGWMTVLNLVPWGEVIKNAPAVADGAKKLWDNVGKKSAPEGGDVAPHPVVDPSSPMDALHTRLVQADAAIAQLHEHANGEWMSRLLEWLERGEEPASPEAFRRVLRGFVPEYRAG